MGFFVQTQSCTVGTTNNQPNSVVFNYSEQGNLGAWVYGLSYFSLADNNSEDLGLGSLVLQITPSTDISNGTITLTPTATYDGDTLPLALYDGTLNLTVQLTVLAWIDPDVDNTGSTSTPSEIMLGMSTSLSNQSQPDTANYGLNGIPRVNVSALAGFDLAFSSNDSGSLYGIGAAAGATINPYSTNQQAYPLMSTQLISGDNDDLAGVGDQYSYRNTVDSALIGMTGTLTGITAGFASTQQASTTSVTLTPSLPSDWAGVTITNAAVFLQSFYLQFQITGNLGGWDGPVFNTLTAGCSSLNIADAGQFSLVSDLVMSGENSSSDKAMSASSYGANYIYLLLAGPVVRGVSPNTGANAGGNTVSISGSNLENVEMVKFGDTPATSFTVSNGQISAVVPAGSGQVDVRVLTYSGISAIVDADTYTYTG